MVEKNTAKDQRRNAKKNSQHNNQPEPLSGSHKTKQKNHMSQTNGEG